MAERPARVDWQDRIVRDQHLLLVTRGRNVGPSRIEQSSREEGHLIQIVEVCWPAHGIRSAQVTLAYTERRTDQIFVGDSVS
jgi:hypothetical protein